jgi:tRNA-splicing ligase RtcB (3'-phosphate/5'-hydroxy nucleic acid ligase)
MLDDSFEPPRQERFSNLAHYVAANVLQTEGATPMPTKINDNLTSWASELDDNALEQALRTSRLPILAGPVCLMSDAHFGLGATVGSVVATKNALLPSAVGVDIGCGMVAAETNLTASDLPDDLGTLHRLLRDQIPAGVGKGHVRSDDDEPEALRALGLPPGSASELTGRQKGTIVAQFGSLGSGNHFVEVCVDERQRVWVVLHSGSRGIGNQLATAHIKTARLVAQEEGQELEDRDLAWLREGRPEFDAYVADMLWAQRYAWGNREQMMDAALAALSSAVSKAAETERINCHHNYATKETHLGEEVWITRKGAIRAGRSDMGVIPGSMGASSFIVRGKGNEASYQSSSHGAGRRLGRKAAFRQLTSASLREAMAGRAWDDTMAESLVDEHPDAYKPIAQVMADQADLVEVVHELHQVVNLKGT